MDGYDLISYFSQKLLKEGKCGIPYFAASRPNICELEAVQRVITMARVTGAAVYVVHVSSAEATEAIRQARREGLPIYGETCPHSSAIQIEKECFTAAVMRSQENLLSHRLPLPLFSLPIQVKPFHFWPPFTPIFLDFMGGPTSPEVCDSPEIFFDVRLVLD